MKKRQDHWKSPWHTRRGRRRGPAGMDGHGVYDEAIQLWPADTWQDGERDFPEGGLPATGFRRPPPASTEGAAV